jgi:hypothetical protein
MSVWSETMHPGEKDKTLFDNKYHLLNVQESTRIRGRSKKIALHFSYTSISPNSRAPIQRNDSSLAWQSLRAAQVVFHSQRLYKIESSYSCLHFSNASFTGRAGMSHHAYIQTTFAAGARNHTNWSLLDLTVGCRRTTYGYIKDTPMNLVRVAVRTSMS